MDLRRALLVALWSMPTWNCHSFLFVTQSATQGMRASIICYLDPNNEKESKADESNPRIVQKRVRGAQIDTIIPSKSKMDDDEQRPIGLSKKDLVKKRKQGEAASAAMDLPMQPIVTTIGGGTNALFENIRKAVVPRWHPVAGVADINPRFRVESPAMTSRGYAASIWRNARKRQPAMWRYALRTFDRMVQQQQQSTGPKLDIINVHYEGAMVAAEKLGWSQRALDIYQFVEKKEAQIRERIHQSPVASKSNGDPKIAIRITENMVLSVIRACVRESVVQKKREPLDRVLQLVIDNLNETHGISVTAIHLNPIAAAYQSLGYTKESDIVLQHKLLDRIGGPEAENVIDTTFNVYDVQAKDKGSYSLLVQSAVQERDWGQAVLALKTMTEAGLYPSNRHLNVWTEISEKRRRPKQI
jgi:hypothetical protein